MIIGSFVTSNDFDTSFVYVTFVFDCCYSICIFLLIVIRSHARGDSVHLTQDDLQFILNVTKEVQEGIIGEHNAPYQFQ